MRLAGIRRTSARIGWAAVAAAVALLPAAGPMLDHHYAERQPGHGHLHLGAVSTHHHHPHAHHHHPHAADRAEPDTQDDQPAGVIFLAAYSGAAPSHAYVSTSASQVSLAFPEPAESPSPFSPAPDPRLLHQSFVTPPTQPPQA